MRKRNEKKKRMKNDRKSMNMKSTKHLKKQRMRLMDL